MAGSNVIEASIVTATMIAEPYPIIAIIGMPETLRPRMAMITVTPANSTDSPAVALARPMATGTDCPAARFWRCRARMNKA